MSSLVSMFRKFSQLCAVALALTFVAQAPAAAQSSALDAVKERGVLRVGWAPWFPYAFKDPKTNQVSGIAVDLIKDIAGGMKVDVQWVEDSWGTMIAGLQADKFDMLMPMAITPPRAEAATFTEPFMKTDLGLMVRSSDKGKYQSWKDLDKDGVSIAAAMGSNTALYAKQQFKKARIVEMKGEPESVTSVITGKVDAWASTYSTFSSSAPGRNQLSIVPGEPFAYSPVALVVRKGDTAMRDRLNEFIAQGKSKGTFLQIAKKHGMTDADVLQ